jgi:hypothetical protein
MLADVGAPGAAILPVLRDIDFFARWEGRDAKPGQSIVPKKFAIFAGGADESVHRSLRNASRWHSSCIR